MTRRRSALALASLAVLGCGACVDPGDREAAWSAFDTPGSVRVHTRNANDAAELIEHLRSTLERFEAELGTPGGDGVLGRLNRGAAEGYHTVDNNDFYRLLLLALDYARASDGAFDPTVGPLVQLYAAERGSPRPPRATEIEVVLNRVGWQKVRSAPEARAFQFADPGMQLDLDGIAKGFALDLVARGFSRPGTRGGVLSLGNNYYAWGRPLDADQWSLDVTDPRAPGRGFVRILGLSSRGVAASGHRAPGTGEDPASRQRVVLNPQTGTPAASGVSAALAVADSAGDADALSTALFVMGARAAGGLLTQTRKVEALLLVDDERGPFLLASASLRGRIELAPELENEVGGRVRYLLPPESF